jgi:hypothetical protein
MKVCSLLQGIWYLHLETENVCTNSLAKVGTNFANKLRSLGQYRSLADSSHGVFYSATGNMVPPSSDR